jgi:methylated-DNA-[protein]-cysteine S-methyltransferase
MSTTHTMVDTRLGPVTLVADGEAITGLYFPHHWYRPADLGERAEHPLLSEAAGQLGAYLAGERDGFDLPLATAGNAFQEQVWALLKQIPYGQTTTYGALARQLGDKSLAQAVGQAVGHNPISVIVPCHRVVGSTGALTGYAGGLDRKQFLLALEEPAPVAAGRLF